MAPSLDIIIVNWNSGTQLQHCLDSVVAANREYFQLHRVVVVDNASSDGSVDRLQQGDLPLRLIRNRTNLGFAAACNEAARGSRATYLLFLNPDTMLFPDSLDTPIRYMEQAEQSGVGIVGIQLTDGEGVVSRSCARFPSAGSMMSSALGLAQLSPRLFPDHQMRTWNHLETRQVDHVIGAFALMRRAVFEQLGGYDEQFFLYLEDLDLSLRMSGLGFLSTYLVSARALHHGCGCSNQIKARRLFYSLRSRIIYCYKHFNWASATGVALATLFIEPFLRIAYAPARGGVREMGDTFAAYAMLWKWLMTSSFPPRGITAARTSGDATEGDSVLTPDTEDHPIAVSEASAKAHPVKVWLTISSFRNDTEVCRILEQVHPCGADIFERILVVDSQGTGAIPSLLENRGWTNVIYRSYGHNLGSGANLCERLRIAAEGGADYAYALNHDGNFDPEVLRALLKAAPSIEALGAAYPLGYLTSAERFNLTGTRELPLPAKLVSERPSASVIDVCWSSSNGALYSTAPAKRGVLPWPAMWMGWEDLEYGWRLTDSGYRQVIVSDAIYRDNYEYQQTWLLKTIDKPASRTYYSFRNLILAIRRSRNRPMFYAVVAYRALAELGLIVLVRDHKVDRIKNLWRGVRDGFAEDLILHDSISSEFSETRSYPRAMQMPLEKQA